MKSKKRLVAIGLGIIIIIGGLIMLRNPFTGGEKDFDKQVETKIANDFSSIFLTPEGDEVTEVTFYREPQNSSDATGNRIYYFYINNQKDWKIGTAVVKETGEISAYGSDNIDLREKLVDKKVDNLKINHWED